MRSWHLIGFKLNNDTDNLKEPLLNPGSLILKQLLHRKASTNILRYFNCSKSAYCSGSTRIEAFNLAKGTRKIGSCTKWIRHIIFPWVLWSFAGQISWCTFHSSRELQNFFTKRLRSLNQPVHPKYITFLKYLKNFVFLWSLRLFLCPKILLLLCMMCCVRYISLGCDSMVQIVPNIGRTLERRPLKLLKRKGTRTI